MKGLLPKLIFLAFCFPLSQSISAQKRTTADPLLRPPKSAPQSCSIIRLAGITSTEGSAAYKRLRYQLAAIDVVEIGLQVFDQLETENAKHTIPAESMSGFLVAADELEDHLHCAAYIIGLWNPESKDEQDISGLTIHAYNQIAASLSVRRSLSKAQFMRRTTNDRTTVMREAEQTAAADKKTRGAQTDLFDMTTYSLLLAVYVDDTSAKTTPFMKLSCDERGSVIEESKRESAIGENDYQKAAQLIFKAVSDHQCMNEP